MDKKPRVKKNILLEKLKKDLLNKLDDIINDESYKKIEEKIERLEKGIKDNCKD